MKQFIQRGMALVLAVVGLVAFLPKAFAGTDSYSIYLNNKLILKQYVGQPLSLASLPLSEANANDKLVVFYSHCGVIGKGRSISLKDEKGVVLKEWKFADSDADGTSAGMSIPVKEVLALQANNPGLSLYYASQQLPGGHMLTRVSKAGKPIALHSSGDGPLRAGEGKPSRRIGEMSLSRREEMPLLAVITLF